MKPLNTKVTSLQTRSSNKNIDLNYQIFQFRVIDDDKGDNSQSILS